MQTQSNELCIISDAKIIKCCKTVRPERPNLLSSMCYYCSPLTKTNTQTDTHAFSTHLIRHTIYVLLKGEEVQRASPYLIFDKEQHSQKSIVAAQGEWSWSEGASECTPDTLQTIPTQTSKEWTDNAFDTSRLLDARPNPAPPHSHDDQSSMRDTPFIRVSVRKISVYSCRKEKKEQMINWFICMLTDF